MKETKKEEKEMKDKEEGRRKKEKFIADILNPVTSMNEIISNQFNYYLFQHHYNNKNL